MDHLKKKRNEIQTQVNLNDVTLYSVFAELIILVAIRISSHHENKPI